MAPERLSGMAATAVRGAVSQVQRLHSKRKRMSVHEELFLNPFEKWSRYGRFPSMFFIHAMLVILVTGQVTFYLRKDITHACETASHFSSLFLGTPSGSVTLYQPGELQDALEKAVQNIFLINDVTFNDVVVTRHGPDALRDDDLDAEEEEHRELNVMLLFRNASRKNVTLSRSSFRQEREEVKKYLQMALPVLYCREVMSLKEMEIDVRLLETVHELPVKGHFLWSVKLRFDGTAVGRFIGTLTYTLESTGHFAGGWMGWLHWHMDALIIGLAILAVVLIGRKVARSLLVMLRLRRAVANAEGCSSLPRLTWKEEMALFSWWWALSAVCHFVQIFAAACCMRRTMDVIDRFSMLGWSCCLSWLNICQYLEFFPGYYVTFSTTGKGMASVCRYMASVLPILTAFMFLGTCQFWQAKTFQGPLASYASLFSLLNGDMVHDAFEELGAVAGWAGHLYLYVFIFIFIYIVLNVNITIIEEAYYSAHFQGLKHQEQVERAKRLTSDDMTSPLCFLSRQTSESPEAAEEILQAQAAGPSSPTALVAGARSPSDDTRQSEAPMQPNVGDNRSSSSPLLRRSPANAKPMRVLMKGSVSPRILDNPRLQGALSAVFPPQPLTPSSLHDGGGWRSSSWSLGDARRRSALGVADPGSHNSLLSIEEEERARGLAGRSLAAASAAASEELARAEATSPAGVGGADASAARHVEWWLTWLPRLTDLLRTTPLPRRSEVSRQSEGGWEELERLMADHSAAVAEVSAALYRELART